MTGETQKRFAAQIHAKYLHALEPIIRLSQTDFSAVSRNISGLMIEPCSEGGAILSATNGKVLACIRDPSGKANRPARVTIPDRLFMAATPPKPLALNDQAAEIEIPMPEWAQPGTVVLTSGFGVVLQQMPLPGVTELGSLGSAYGPVDERVFMSGEYRVHDDKHLLKWRKIFSRERKPHEGEPAPIDPILFAWFDRLIDLHRNKEDGSPRLVYLDHGAVGAATYIRVEGAPDFIGAIGPMFDGSPPPEIPVWATETPGQEDTP